MSVVTRAHTERRWDDLAATIRSASPQAVPPLEVIVLSGYDPVLTEQVRGELGGSIDPRWPGNRPATLHAAFAWVVGCTDRALPLSRSLVRS